MYIRDERVRSGPVRSKKQSSPKPNGPVRSKNKSGIKNPFRSGPENKPVQNIRSVPVQNDRIFTLTRPKYIDFYADEIKICRFLCRPDQNVEIFTPTRLEYGDFHVDKSKINDFHTDKTKTR